MEMIKSSFVYRNGVNNDRACVARGLSLSRASDVGREASSGPGVGASHPSCRRGRAEAEVFVPSPAGGV